MKTATEIGKESAKNQDLSNTDLPRNGTGNPRRSKLPSLRPDGTVPALDTVDQRFIGRARQWFVTIVRLALRCGFI
jgi:hypothetical protein